MDSTQLELREVESTGTLQAGEKALAELRKRKLITQRYSYFIYTMTHSISGNLPVAQERTVVLGA